MATAYIATTIAGKTITYESLGALNRAKARRKDVIVESWREDNSPPFDRANDASAWDTYRTQRGRPSY